MHGSWQDLQRCLRDLNHPGERLRITHREVGEDLTVKPNVGLLQRVGNDLEQQANNVLLQMRLRNSLEASRR